MSEELEWNIFGLKLMVLGVQLTLVGRFLVRSEILAWIGGAVVLIGLVLR